MGKDVDMEEVGAERSRSYERSVEDIYTMQMVDTIYFMPSKEYIRQSMAKDDVKDYVEGSSYEPVYCMLTCASC